MAPVKPPKKALKSMEKKKQKVEKPIINTNKVKKRNYNNFSIYLYRILRNVTNDNVGISKKSIVIMNNFVIDMLEKIAEEAARLISHSKKTTLSSREIQSAVKLLLPGELAKHANAEGMKAVTMYINNRSQETTD